MPKVVHVKTVKPRKTVVKPEVKIPVEEPVAYDNAGEDWNQEYEEENTQDAGEGYDQGEGDEEPEQMEEEGTEIEDEAEKLEEHEQEDTDPTVLFRMYVARTEKMLSSGDIKKFLNIKQVKVMQVTQPEWIPIAEVRVCDADDKEKLLALSRRTVGGFEVKFEVAGESDLLLQTPQIAERSVVLAEGLSAAATVQDLQELFPNAREVRLPIPKAGEKRTALLEFNTANEAEEVIGNKQGIKLHDEELVLKAHKVSALASSVAIPSLSTEDVTTTDENKKVLFIGNLLYETLGKTVRAFFDNCKSVRLLRFGPRGKSKGMGFVHFHTAADALKALIEKKDTKLEGRQILLQFADGERRTAEDYRNKPAKTAYTTKTFRDRPKPYSPPAANKNTTNRWYSRSEVEKGMSFANESQNVQHETRKVEPQSSRNLSTALQASRPMERSEVSTWRGRQERPVGTGMGRGLTSRPSNTPSSIPGTVGRFSNTHGALSSGYSGYKAGQGAVDRRYNNGRAAVSGGLRNEHHGMAHRFDEGRTFMAGGIGNTSNDFAPLGSTGLQRTPKFDRRDERQDYTRTGLTSGLHVGRQSDFMEADRGEALYRAPGLDVHMDLQEELERTRRLERRLQIALEKRATGSGLGDGHREFNAGEDRAGWRDYGSSMRDLQYGDFNTGEERAVWRDDGSSMRGGQYDRYDQGSYPW